MEVLLNCSLPTRHVQSLVGARSDPSNENEFCEKFKSAYEELLQQKKDYFTVYKLLINTLTKHFQTTTFSDLIRVLPFSFDPP